MGNYDSRFNGKFRARHVTAASIFAIGVIAAIAMYLGLRSARSHTNPIPGMAQTLVPVPALINDKPPVNSGAVLPWFGGTSNSASQSVIAHYLAQITTETRPRLTDWQKLAEQKVRSPDLKKALQIPMGPGNFVMSLCQDRQGRIWIGTEGGGVWRYDQMKPTAEQWTRFTVKDGLGDDFGYAIACDLMGRVWVGHLNHGVSVYNGVDWQNYDIVAGLRPTGSRSGRATLAGAPGERIYSIAVSPFDGDVWIGSNAGLGRYLAASNKWDYYTRADGLPSDQITSLAFCTDGTLAAATECDGLALGKIEGEAVRWKVSQALSDNSNSTSKKASYLPTNMINQVTVGFKDKICLATARGVAWSNDRGDSWKWFQSLEQDAGSSPRYTTCAYLLSETDVLVGTRDQGALVFHENEEADGNLAMRSIIPKNAYVECFFIDRANDLLIGCYGEGLFCRSESPTQSVSARSESVAVSEVVSFPKSAELDSDRLALASHSILDVQHRQKDESVILSGQDWRTQGTWLGRYGHFWALLAGTIAPKDLQWGTGSASVTYSASFATPPPKYDFVRAWVSSTYTSDPRSLELFEPYLDSRVAKGLTTEAEDRRQSEWDDHGEAYPSSSNGPGLLCNLVIPKGDFYLSVYNVNDDGHNNRPRSRDFGIYVCQAEEEHGETNFDLSSARILARARVHRFWGGVYTTFLVRGPNRLIVCEDRNGSFNTTLNGLFLDEINEFPEPYYPPSFSNSGRMDKNNRTQDPLPSLASLGDALGFVERYRAACRETAQAFDIRKLKDADNNFDLTYARSLCGLRLFESCESYQRRSSVEPARDLEKALRWDGIIQDIYPNYCRDLVVGKKKKGQTSF